MKRILLFSFVVLFATYAVISMNFVTASEVRTLELFPIMDSFVEVGSPQRNYGKELYLLTEYEYETVIHATTFDIATASRKVMAVYLPKNGKIAGSFSAAEGDINFRIRNGAETVTYVDETFVESLNFSFVAPYSGNYGLSFENLGYLEPTKTVSLSDVVLTIEPFGVVCSPIFLLFDLSLIPTEATINTANLSLCFRAISPNMYNIVQAYYCSQTSWSEQLITFENAPLSQSYLIESSPLSLAEVHLDTRCKTDVKADVVRSLPNGKLTEIIAAVGGEPPGGRVEFYSRESEDAPKLEIAYTYVSATCSLSSTFLIEGQSVAAAVATDPFQNGGNLKIQYSVDQVNWINVRETSGGTTSYALTPPAGRIYVRGVWEMSLKGGSYIAPSPVSTIYVIPVYLLVVVPIAVTVAATGIYLWRRKRHKTPIQPASANVVTHYMRTRAS